MSVLMTSQHLEEIEIYAKNIIMINNGKVLYNGEKTNIGYDRTENIYELTAATTLHDLEKILSPLPATVLHNGKYFIIATPRSVAPLTVLNQLLSAGIMPDHFCNISQSVKRYFDAYQTVVI
jgi:ABC-type multidrug transport system ATPase subunit